MNENKLYRFGVDIGDDNDYEVLSHYGELFNFHILFNKGMLVIYRLDANNPFHVISSYNYHEKQ